MGCQTQRQVEARRQERKKKRKGVSLTDNLVTPGLSARYHKAAVRILSFWRESQAQPRTWDDMDVATGQWLEHTFAEGASDGLAALQHFLPKVAEPPIRVLPISPLMMLAISGACVRLGYVDAAASFLLCFDTFLRPGELRKKHFTWAGGSAVLSEKTERRRNDGL